MQPTSSELHVGFVTPAYGEHIKGGAEHGARMIAEHLARLGAKVSVFTTPALDYRRWEWHYPLGTSELNGVTVARFESSVRSGDFESVSRRVLADPSGASPKEQTLWLEAQGPVCEKAVEAAEHSGADVVVCYPYLYWPIVETVRRLGRRAVLQPAAHDELPIHLPLYREVFGRPGGLIFHSEAEAALVRRLFPSTLTAPQATLGLGVDPPEGQVASEGEVRAKLGLDDAPYYLCLGRVDQLKGSHLLARYWDVFKRRRPGPSRLVLAGTVAASPPPARDLVLAGPVDEPFKWGLIQAATALISPSPLESFSLVLLEAWEAGRPVLVNGACTATREHCRRSGGGVAFDGYASFEAALELLETRPALARALGEAGRQYVARNYRWSSLAPRYLEVLLYMSSLARRDRL